MITNTVYECPECGERTLDRRCEDCNLFTRKLGPGGPCPHCEELALTAELLDQTQDQLALSYTGNVTSSSRAELICDDTLHHKSGRQVHGAGVFREAVRSTVRRVRYALGLNLVVVTLRVPRPGVAARSRCRAPQEETTPRPPSRTPRR